MQNFTYRLFLGDLATEQHFCQSKMNAPALYRHKATKHQTKHRFTSKAAGIAFLAFCFLLSANIAFAQQLRNIKGKVTDQDGNPLPGVTVSPPVASQGTKTDNNGNYTVRVAVGAVLHFSYISFLPQDVKVGQQTEINVKLKEDVKGLNEVVVIGYGSQTKGTLTGAISSVKGEDILKSPQGNITNDLAGRLPGVFTAERSGKPGADAADIFIRGRATTGNPAALIIVDGAERASFGEIDPNEIESINVLKDASATALFGIKGGNGVILITTKSGKEGKAQISITTNEALQTYTNLPKIEDAYTEASILNEMNANVGKPAAFTSSDLQKFKDHSDPSRYPDFNWFDYLFRKFYAQTQQNVNVSGGSKVAKYFISGGYLFQDGMFKNFDNNPDGYKTTNDYSRYNFRSNLDLTLSKKLTISLKLGARLERRYTPAGNLTYVGGEVEYLFSRINGIPAYAFNPTLPDGRFQENPNAGVNLNNPLGWITRTGYYINQTNAMESTTVLNYNLGDVLKGLSFKTQYAYDAYFVATRRQSGAYTSYYYDSNGNIVQGNASFSTSDLPLGAVVGTYNGTNNYNIQMSFNYNRSFGKSTVTALALAQRQSTGATGAQPYFGAQGFVARATYNYNNKYYFEVNGAYNGSENFAPTKRYGLFPAYSAGYTVSNEKFFKRALPWISYFKIRGSYGTIGFDKIGGDRFLYLDQYNQTSSVYLDASAVAPSTKINRAVQFGYPTSINTYPVEIHSKIGNPSITWEQSVKRNIGFETSFFKDLISVNVDVFDENRTNILLNRQSGLTTYGEAYPQVNFGKVYNHGYEIELKHQMNLNGFNYAITGQFSFARNKIIDIDEPAGTPAYQKQAGYPINQVRGYLTDGFYQSQTDINAYYPNQLGKPIPGDLKFKDYNGDGVINSNDIVPIGYTEVPEITYSLQPYFSWKGFSLSIVFQGVSHVSSTIQFDQRNLSSNQIYANMMGRWTPATAATATWPSLQPAVGGNFMSYAVNDFLLTDGSYLKLRNANLGYNIPKSLTQKIKLKTVRVFVSGQNLYTWTKVLYLDPENFQRVVPQQSFNVYPTTRVFNLGVNVTL